MPGCDGTGPLGGGRRTGGGFGNCPGNGGSGQGIGRSAGAGRGPGRGRRAGLQGPVAQGTAVQDSSVLERLRAELDQVKQQLRELVSRIKG
jgi:hypothetical protein